MCAYLSKSEDESTEAMKQAAKEASEAGKSGIEKLKSILKAYRTHREMSIQEAVSIIFPEIWLRLLIVILLRTDTAFVKHKKKLKN